LTWIATKKIARTKAKTYGVGSVADEEVEMITTGKEYLDAEL
jgi:hypothetical protein